MLSDLIRNDEIILNKLEKFRKFSLNQESNPMHQFPIVEISIVKIPAMNSQFSIF